MQRETAQSRSGAPSVPPFGRWTGHLAVMLVLSCAWPAAAAVFYSGGQSIPMTPTPGEVLIELDGSRGFAEVLQDLAAEGFTSQQVIDGLPQRFPYRKLFLDAADPSALARARAVQGIRSVRHTYQLMDSPTTIIPTGQVVAKFQPGTTLEVARALAVQYGAALVEPIEGLPQTYILQPTDEAARDAFAVAAALHQDPQTVYSHPSILMKDLLKYEQAAQQAPADPLFSFQWHLNNIGQLPGATPGADIKVLDAWEITMGQNVVVGINDTAVQWQHEDLVDNFLIGFDYVDNDGDPSPAIPISGEGHGTSVAGLIAARANNVGLRGVAPLCQFTAARFGASLAVADTDVARSFIFHEANGAVAINNSWGLGLIILPTIPTASLLLPNVISDAINRVAVDGRAGRGVLVLFSSGNDRRLISFGNIYAAIPNVMAIGATLRNDLLACYSNFGPEQSVVAPGGGSGRPRSMGGGLPLDSGCFERDMATTDVDENLFARIDPNTGQPILTRPVLGYNPPTRVVGGVEVPDPEVIDFPQTAYTYQFNGTSSACPVATGVAALIFSISDTYTAEQVRNIMEHTSDKIMAPHERFDPVTGHNERYGHGRLNAFRAVEAARAGHTWPSPIKDVQTVSSESQGILMWSNPKTDEATVLVARSNTGQLDWAPMDAQEYEVGQMVAPGIVIVANSPDLTSYTETLTGEPFTYAIFVRNAGVYYSWGRRATFRSAGSPNAGPQASLTASVSTGRAPLAVHFAGGAVDPSGVKNLSFAWQFGDGFTGSGAAIDHVYTSPGEYTVRLTVSKEGEQPGEAVARIVVTSGANRPPQVSQVRATPTTGQAPLVVLLEGTASDPDGTIVRHEWRFGDGTIATGLRVEHVYLHPGNYEARLIVTDNQGATAFNSTQIIVTGSGTTAAQTDPTGILSSLPRCAAGLPGAVAATAAVMLTLMVVRRRR